MKKLISILSLGVLTALALVGCDQTSDHGMSGKQAMEHQHDSGDMSDMSHGGKSDTSHDDHEASAGRPGDPDNVSRTIEVTMADTMRFTPDQLTFKAGETVRFVVSNNGKIRHEMVIGSMAELAEHAENMRGNMAMQHAEPNMVSLAPGAQGEIVWQFDKAGALDFACLVPGHLEAGMVGKIEVN